MRKGSCSWKEQRPIQADQGERPSFFCKDTEILQEPSEHCKRDFCKVQHHSGSRVWPLPLWFSLMLSAHLNSLLPTTCLQVIRPWGLWHVTLVTVPHLFPQSSHQHLVFGFKFLRENLIPGALLHKWKVRSSLCEKHMRLDTWSSSRKLAAGSRREGSMKDSGRETEGRCWRLHYWYLNLLTLSPQNL